MCCLQGYFVDSLPGPLRGKRVLVRDLFWAPYTLQLIESFIRFQYYE